MSHTAAPTETPNVVVENPTIRRYANIALGVAGTIVTAAVIVDLAIPAIDYAFITDPASKIVLGFAALFGLAVTVPNIPRR